MYTQIEIPVEGKFTPFWQHDSLPAEFGADDAEYAYSLGTKEFVALGQFQYHWPLQYLTREDVQAIVNAGQRLLDITKE